MVATLSSSSPKITWPLLPDDFILPDDPVENQDHPTLAAALTDAIAARPDRCTDALITSNFALCAGIGDRTICKAPDWMYVRPVNPSPQPRRSYTPHTEGAVPLVVMLDLDKMYQWEVSLVCDPRNRELDWRTSRWIQRVEPSDINTSLDEELQTATPLEQVVLYGKAGIWHDALMALADLRQTQGDSTVLVSLWDDLLNSEAVQLGRVTQAPLLDCCQAIQEDGNQN